MINMIIYNILRILLIIIIRILANKLLIKESFYKNHRKTQFYAF